MNTIRATIRAAIAVGALLVAFPAFASLAQSALAVPGFPDAPWQPARVPIAPSAAMPADAPPRGSGGDSDAIDLQLRFANIPSRMTFDPATLGAGQGLRYVYYYSQVLACNANGECLQIVLQENCSTEGVCESNCGVDGPAGDTRGTQDCPLRFDPATDLACRIDTELGSAPCTYALLDDRTTYEIEYRGGLALPEGVDRMAAYAYYASGPSNPEVPCVPVRADDVGAGGLTREDPPGDVFDGNEGCNPVVEASDVMDAAIDYFSLDLVVDSDDPPVEETGGTVVIGLSSSTPGPLAVGDPVSYTLRLSNQGGSTIHDAFCTAEGPTSRFRMESVDCEGASIDGAGVFWNVGVLEPGQGMTCTFRGRVTAPDPECEGSCDLTLQAGAQFEGADGPGSRATRAVVGLLAPPALASKRPDGAPTTLDSTAPSLSADGSILAFRSYEKALVGDNVNTEGADIYLRDGTGVRLISRTAGGQLRGDNRAVDVALNGRAAAFVHVPGSSGSGLDAQEKGAANAQLCASQPNSLFQMECDTTGSDGAPLDGDVESPSISADGKRVAFCSSATNWVANDTNGARDVFVKDQDTNPPTITRISVTADGAQGNGDSCDPMISGNGRFVVFTTRAPNLGGSADRAQVVRKDLETGAVTVITQNGGAPADADAGPPSISADGQRIAFASRASNLVAGVGNGRRNVFVFDGAPSRSAAKGGSVNNLFVMRGAGGQLPNGDSGDPKLACGGSALSVTSAANNLVPGDSNSVSDYFVYGLDSGRVVRPAPAATGVQPNGAAGNAELDCDATAGAYDSEATNAAGNPNPNADVTLQDDPLRSDDAAIVIDGSYSGNWYNPGQSGHGFLLEALPNGQFYATWYVYRDGEPLFLQGIGSPSGNRLVVDLLSFTSSGFPVGAERPTSTPWGRITFTFTSSNDGLASWQPVAPGFTAGSTTLRRLSTASRVESDRDGVLSACYSGIWYDSNRSGFGFNVEFNETANGGRIVQAFWYTYQPDGSPLWLIGVGDATPGGVVLELFQLGGVGAQFPPNFLAEEVTRTRWGSATLTFTPNRLDVTYGSILPGYGSGSLPGLQRLTVLDQRACSG